MHREPLEQRESNLRSLLKAFSWRIIATLTTILIAWQISGEVDKALAIGGVEFFAKFFVPLLAHARKDCVFGFAGFHQTSPNFSNIAVQPVEAKRIGQHLFVGRNIWRRLVEVPGIEPGSFKRRL